MPETASTPLPIIPFEVPAPLPVINPGLPSWLVKAAMACGATFHPTSPYRGELLPDSGNQGCYSG